MRKTENRYVDNGDGSTTLFITQDGKPKLTVVIDTEDAEKVKAFHWNRHTMGYGVSYYSFHSPPHLLHRLIMETPEGLEVDHINHDKANNRKANMRNVTKSFNARNRKAAKNIRVDNRNGSVRYRVYFHLDKHYKNYGSFASMAEAVKYRDKVKRELFKV